MKNTTTQLDFDSRLKLYKEESLKHKKFISSYHNISEEVILWKGKVGLIDKVIFWFMQKRNIRVAVIYKDLNE